MQGPVTLHPNKRCFWDVLVVWTWATPNEMGLTTYIYLVNLASQGETPGCRQQVIMACGRNFQDWDDLGGDSLCPYSAFAVEGATAPSHSTWESQLYIYTRSVNTLGRIRHWHKFKRAYARWCVEGLKVLNAVSYRLSKQNLKLNFESFGTGYFVTSYSFRYKF